MEQMALKWVKRSEQNCQWHTVWSQVIGDADDMEEILINSLLFVGVLCFLARFGTVTAVQTLNGVHFKYLGLYFCICWLCQMSVLKL